MLIDARTEKMKNRSDKENQAIAMKKMFK